MVAARGEGGELGEGDIGGVRGDCVEGGDGSEGGDGGGGELEGGA